MKHVWGLSDVLGSALAAPVACADCGATTHLAGRACASCLMRQALNDGDSVSAENFEEVLAEARVTDHEWHLGNYEILAEIGRGGMGVIYRARQRHSRRIVAVKCVQTYQARSAETLQRFRREAEAAASLDHPNILPIYEVSESEDGVPFFSMKWATGGSLREVSPALQDEPKLCVELMTKVARAVAYAHENGILHRDLQPGNILLDARGEPLVSDFGLAKWLDGESNLTHTLTTLGTPGYIAPEQASGAAGDVTAAADIYSLGAILFNLFTNRPPFVGANAISVIRQAADSAAPKLRAIAPAIDPDLETIVDRCLERDPRARYESAAALADDLERWVNGHAIRARPVRMAARVWRWSRRNPALAAAAVACVAATGALGWFLSASAIRTAPAHPEKSVAVLPFENLGPEQENLFFTDGMQEDILTDLGKVADLKVISRSSVHEYVAGAPRNLRAIGRSLGVRHLLEGSVRRDGDRVRINAHLIDAETGQQLWAEEYNRQLADVFVIQSEIAQKIASRLRAQLSAVEKATIAAQPTADLQAYDLYLRAKEIARNVSLWNENRAHSEITLLDRAVARDPAFVPALCTLARAQLELYWYNYEHHDATLESARRAIDTAAHVQPDAGEVHLARAILHYWGHRDYAPALSELAKAGAALPNDAEVAFFSGLILRRQGDWEASTREFKRAQEIDPHGVRNLFELARSNLFALKRYQEAAALCESVLAWRPDEFDFDVARAKVDVASRADLTRMRAVVARGTALPDPPSGLAFARLELALAERDYVAARDALARCPFREISEAGYATPAEYYAGIIAAGLGQTDDARSAFLRAAGIAAANLAMRPGDAKAYIVKAEIDARLGRRDDAITAGERALQMLPIAKDAIDGPVIMMRLASIYAQLRETNRALDLLETVAKLPSATNYGELTLEGCWDPIRREPRFEAILASLASRD